MSGQFVRPMGIAPAPFMRSTTGESTAGIASASAGSPQFVDEPTRSMFCFTVNGTPCNGPSGSPLGQRPVGGGRRGAGLVGQHTRDRVEGRVHFLDAREMRFDDLCRRDFLARDHRGQLPRTVCPQLGHRVPLLDADPGCHIRRAALDRSRRPRNDRVCLPPGKRQSLEIDGS